MVSETHWIKRLSARHEYAADKPQLGPITERSTFHKYLASNQVLQTPDKTPSAPANLHDVTQGRLQGLLACLLKTIARNQQLCNHEDRVEGYMYVVQTIVSQSSNSPDSLVRAKNS